MGTDLDTGVQRKNSIPPNVTDQNGVLQSVCVCVIALQTGEGGISISALVLEGGLDGQENR